MSTTQPRLMPRFAHLAGTTFCTYTPDAKYLLTAGNNNIVRKFDVAKFDAEPATIEHSSDGITGIATLNDKFVTCGDDGAVNLYDMSSDSIDKMLLQTSLPARSIAISPDGQWVAVSSEELCVRIVNTDDHLKTFTLRDPPKPIKHVTFHPTGSYITCSGTDGIIYIYSLTSEPPTLIKKLDGVIATLEPDSEASSKVVWHPSGETFAAATPTRDIHIISRSNWKRTRVFSGGHTAEITDIQWSSNGAFLCSAGMDGKLLVWEARTQVVVHRFEYRNITSVSWHPRENKISFTTNQGQLLTLPNPVPETHVEELLRPRGRAVEAQAERPPPGGQQQAQQQQQQRQREPERRRKRTPDMLDELMGGVDDEEFIEDDDGAGYVQHTNGFGQKRGIDALDDYEDYGGGKRFAGGWSPSIQEPFQPGSTPWKGNRKYLCLNLIGIVWTVDQETHNTVTVEFYDREQYRGYHFMDPFMYDKACLNENGTLYSNQPKDGNPAMIFYRPHETWTSRSDWKTQLPTGEEITSIALSENYIVACTSTGYVRTYTLFGTPLRIYRQKQLPFVTCSAWRDYIFIVGNGPVGPDGNSVLTYTIENVKRDETIQNNDTLPLPQGEELKSVFWSDNGDPYIYDTTGTLLVLLHWRTEGRAKWVPILDTKILDRQLTGKVEESYWPVAVAQDKFHCIILKGTDQHPYFPRPLLSEFNFRIPIYTPKPNPSLTTLDLDNDIPPPSTNQPTQDELGENFVRESVLVALKDDTAQNTEATAEQRLELAKRENAIDKALIQLLAYSCREEDGGERALEICGLFRQRRSWELAVKVALKYGRVVLAEKIGERRGELDVEEMEE